KESREAENYARALFETILPDVVVQDAAGALHRGSQASRCQVIKYVSGPKVIGSLVEEELSILHKLAKDPRREVVAIMQGAKLEGKLEVMKSFAKGIVDTIVVFGKMAIPFIRKEEMAREIITIAAENNVRLILPGKVAAVKLPKGKSEGEYIQELKKTKEPVEAKVFAVDEVPQGWLILDGEKTDIKEQLSKTLERTGTIIINGTAGLVENGQFALGTNAAIDIVVEYKSRYPQTNLVGLGGDGVAAILKRLGEEKAKKLFVLLSTMGGSALIYLSGKELTGLQFIDRKYTSSFWPEGEDSAASPIKESEAGILESRGIERVKRILFLCNYGMFRGPLFVLFFRDILRKLGISVSSRAASGRAVEDEDDYIKKVINSCSAEWHMRVSGFYALHRAMPVQETNLQMADLILIAEHSQIVSLNKRFLGLKEEIAGKIVFISAFLPSDNPFYGRDLPDIGEPFIYMGNPSRPFTAEDLFKLYEENEPNLIRELEAVNAVSRSSSPAIGTDEHGVKAYLRVKKEVLQVISKLMARLDYITREHCLRTAVISDWIGVELKFSLKERKKLFIASILHDIGKSKAETKELVKKGRKVRFSHKERLIMREHAISGQGILSECGILDEDILKAVRSHHERYCDPQRPGYPDDLRGKEIPYLARLITLADVLEARVSNLRKYPGRLTIEGVIEDYRTRKGIKYDPDMAEAAIKLFSRKLSAKNNKELLAEIDNGAGRLNNLFSEAALNTQKRSSSPVDYSGIRGQVTGNALPIVTVIEKNQVMPVLRAWEETGERKIVMMDDDWKKLKWNFLLRRQVILSYVGSPYEPLAVLLTYQEQELGLKYLFIDMLERDKEVRNRRSGRLLFLNFVMNYGRENALLILPQYRGDKKGGFDAWIDYCEQLDFEPSGALGYFFRPAGQLSERGQLLFVSSSPVKASVAGILESRGIRK
ncbi:MAG: phosphoglycerate kinase, partial [Candidatus Omnitrophica bacterium]|nr:phosphoglycerate kinase [Candidatus Omnitrophota bacterium]